MSVFKGKRYNLDKKISALFFVPFLITKKDNTKNYKYK